MSRIFKNRKLVRRPKYCRFCANHGENKPERGHRSECKYRHCTCVDCKKNSKKVQTSKDHRKNKDAAKDPQEGSTNNSTFRLNNNGLISCAAEVSELNETASTLVSFIESNLNDYMEDISRGAGSSNGHESSIQNIPIIFVDDNMNEIENFGSTEQQATDVEYLESSYASIVECLMTEHGTDVLPIYHALLNACGGDYAEAVRRIIEAKKKY